MWSQALGVTGVGVHDDFFSLGGDSMRSLSIAANARVAFDVTLTPRDVLTARTVASLAELVEEKILRDVEAMLAESTDDPQE